MGSLQLIPCMFCVVAPFLGCGLPSGGFADPDDGRDEQMVPSRLDVTSAEERPQGNVAEVGQGHSSHEADTTDGRAEAVFRDAHDEGGDPSDGSLSVFDTLDADMGGLSDGSIEPEVIADAAGSGPYVLARDASLIELADVQTTSVFGQSWEARYFRNPAYSCGVSGTYTFVVVEPMNSPDGEAPLWVYLHGGGVGYFDPSGAYQTMKEANGVPVNNSEESFQALFNHTVLSQVLKGNNQAKNTTMRRRLQQGYRVLVPSLCDHDLYSGRGTPYPNNPKTDAQVNGLQATMAAVDFVSGNFPTTDVFVHGTSAGAAGAWSLAYQYHLEGVALTGIIMDAYLITDRLFPLFTARKGEAGFPFGESFQLQAVIDKIGGFVDPGQAQFPSPEEAVLSGFTEVPLLDIVGDQDAFCGGNQPIFNEVHSSGFANSCRWVHDGLVSAIAAQPMSPHQVSFIEGGGHVVTTQDGGPAIGVVEGFIESILEASPPHPFD